MHIMATDWGLTLKSDGTGFYNDLARLVLPKNLGQIDYEILPYKRAKRAFLARSADCLYPSSFEYLVNTGTITQPKDFIHSHNVLAAQSHIFAPPGTQPPARTEDIQGQTIAYALGSGVPSSLKSVGSKFVAVSDEVGKARMLLEGRIDLLAAVLPDAKFVFDSLGTDLPPYTPQFTITSTEIGLICYRSESNEAFIKRLNSHLAELIRGGTLKGFLSSHGLDPAAHMPRQE